MLDLSDLVPFHSGQVRNFYLLVFTDPGTSISKVEFNSVQYLTLYSVNMTYNLKKSMIQWDSVYICICLHPGLGSLSAQCVVLCTSNLINYFKLACCLENSEDSDLMASLEAS